MKRLLLPFLLFPALCFAGSNSVQITFVESGGSTTYFSEDFEDWTDLTGFDGSDLSPTDMSLDTNSKLSGTNSIKFDTQDVGLTYGRFNYTDAEAFASVEIYIDSAGSAASSGEVVYIGSIANGTGTSKMVAWTICYDTDHFEANLFYRDDPTDTLTYVLGSSATGGVTISTDTSHILYMYIKPGTGADGEIWFALDSAAWTKVTSLDINENTGTPDRIQVSSGSPAGSKEAGDWDYYLDDLWAGDTEPSR